jgi:hypothetical protein
MKSMSMGGIILRVSPFLRLHIRPECVPSASLFFPILVSLCHGNFVSLGRIRICSPFQVLRFALAHSPSPLCIGTYWHLVLLGLALVRVVDGLLLGRERSVVLLLLLLLLLESSIGSGLVAGLLRHVHTLLLGVVALGDGALSETGLHFLLLLDEGTATAPVAGAAIVHAAALDAKLLTDLTTLHHGVAGERC